MHKRKKRHHSRNQSGVTVLEREARIDLAKRPADGLGVAFLGASGTVTGSRYLVDDGETQIVVDSGLFGVTTRKCVLRTLRKNGPVTSRLRCRHGLFEGFVEGGFADLKASGGLSHSEARRNVRPSFT